MQDEQQERSSQLLSTHPFKSPALNDRSRLMLCHIVFWKLYFRERKSIPTRGAIFFVLISIWRLYKLILDHLICPFRTGFELSSQRRQNSSADLRARISRRRTVCGSSLICCLYLRSCCGCCCLAFLSSTSHFSVTRKTKKKEHQRHG